MGKSKVKKKINKCERDIQREANTIVDALNRILVDVISLLEELKNLNAGG